MTELKQNFWETTYTQHIAKMIGICYRYVRNRQIAEDLAHDVFLNAIDKSASFKGEGYFEAWLNKIAVNEALKYLRDQKKKEHHKEWIQYENETMVLNEEVHPMDFTEEELLDAIDQLPEHHKMVFNLFVIDKFSHAEIAHELGISEGTSKSHLARARKKIRTILLEKEKGRHRIFAFLWPFKVWSIDKTYKNAFSNFELAPETLIKITIKDPHPHSIVLPKFNSYSILSNSFIKSGIALGSIAVSLVTVSILLEKEPDAVQNINSEIPRAPSEQIAGNAIKADNTDSVGIVTNNAGNIITDSKNIDSTTATISNNAIIPDENNLNNTDMKRLNTVGALLLAGASMGFDSSKNQELKYKAGLKLPDIQFQEKKNDSAINIKEGEGTFNASKILWSSKNHQVYMKGIGMKAKFGKDKFDATGTVTFLGEVYYLLIDGQEAPLDKNIKLSDGDYSVKALSIRESTQKYGEKGKKGVVEIAKL